MENGKIKVSKIGYYHDLNPPIIVGEALGRVITGGMFQGNVMEIKPDNRYKDGNIQIVNGKIRGNSRTVRVVRLEI